MSGAKSGMGLKPFADIFSTEEERQEAAQERVVHIPLAEMHYFKTHPFKVVDDEKMAETAESITAHGVLVPALARPDPSGGYEIVSGHRRHRASELAGLVDMPVIIREMDDDTATIIMVDSNLQRENLLPGEKAWAYRLKLEAMKRQTGRPIKNGSQVGNNSLGQKSSDILAEQMGESKNQIFRFIRLTSLLPPLLDAVDEKRLAFGPAVEASYLTLDEQGWLLDVMERDECSPSLNQAQRLKSFSQGGKLTEDVIVGVMSEEKPLDSKVVIKQDKLGKYFPKSYTPHQMEEVIYKLLEGWAKTRARERSDGR